MYHIVPKLCAIPSNTHTHKLSYKVLRIKQSQKNRINTVDSHPSGAASSFIRFCFVNRKMRVCDVYICPATWFGVVVSFLRLTTVRQVTIHGKMSLTYSNLFDIGSNGLKGIIHSAQNYDPNNHVAKVAIRARFQRGGPMNSFSTYHKVVRIIVSMVL